MINHLKEKWNIKIVVSFHPSAEKKREWRGEVGERDIGFQEKGHGVSFLAKVEKKNARLLL